jgi:two-component system chemotaxis response regulator CheY
MVYMASGNEKPQWPFFEESDEDEAPAEVEVPVEEESLESLYEYKRVLIADDSTVMRKIIKNSLNQLGFADYVEAEDGHAALREVGEDPVDLIISDWNMPKMTGLEFLKFVRGHGNLKDIPFLMITSEGDYSKIIEAVKVGVSQYIVKPFKPEQLQEKVKQILVD